MVRAAFFDLDKTILDTSSNVALSGPFIEAGLMNRRTAITSFLVQLPYLLSGADESRMGQMAEAMGRMARGRNAAFLEATVEDALERTIQPVCYAQALAVIDGIMTEDEAVDSIALATRQLARRQVKWLRPDPRVHWLDVEEFASDDAVATRVVELAEREAEAALARS